MKRTKTPRASPPAKTSRRTRLHWLNTQLAELVPHCPWALRNPAHCPLHGLRMEESADISKWIDGLSIDEKEYLVLYHRCCLALKQQRANATRRSR